MALTVNELNRRTGEAINRGIIKTQQYLELKFPDGYQIMSAHDIMKIFNELKNNIRDELINASNVHQT